MRRCRGNRPLPRTRNPVPDPWLPSVEEPRKGGWRGKEAGLRPSAQPISSVLNRMRDAMMGDDSDGMPVFNVFARSKKAKVLLTIKSLCAHLLAS